ncbi:MAG: hypothetical protein FWD11_11440, partial [Micrococcales bacterium]|nr:hypothetical protein [Micrococcales bacterium]
AVATARDLWELAELVLCLGLAGRPDQPQDSSDLSPVGLLGMLRTYLQDDRPLVRFAAARTWVRLSKDVTGEVVDILLDALTSTELDDYEVCYLAEGPAATAAAAALSELPPEVSDQALDQLCDVMRKSGSTDSYTVSRALLDIVFPERAWDGEAQLTEPQRAAIRAICDAPGAWVFINNNEVLRHNGLPTDRDELRALADARPDNT